MAEHPNFACPVCLEPPDEAVESSCDCAAVLCQSHASPIKTCPLCRQPCRFSPNRAVRRVVAAMSAACPDGCGAKLTRGDLPSHAFHCSLRSQSCPMASCSFAARRGPLFEHLEKEHGRTVLQMLAAAGGTLPGDHASPNQQPPAGAPDRVAIVLSGGVRRRLGSSGKFYCRQRTDFDCGCCNGRCGPTNGHNCLECMRLDIERRGLAPGWLVNVEGFSARKGETGKFYCGRRMQELVLESFCDGYCGPTNGPNCRACQDLDNHAAEGGYYAALLL